MASRKKASPKAPKKTRKAAKKALEPKSPKPAVKAVKKKAAKRTARVHGPVYEAKTGRWREGGKYVPAPKLRSLRKDKAGRPIDARGKRVPESALPKTKKPRKKAKSPKVKGPRYLEVWDRDGSGFISAGEGPTFDGHGAGLPRAPAPTRQKPKLVKPPPEVVELKAGEPMVEKFLVGSSFRNKEAPTNAAEILGTYLERASKKGPLEVDDVAIYNFGLKFVGDGDITPIIPELVAGLPKGARLEYSNTKLGTEVYVRFNLDRTPNLLHQVERKLDKSTGELTQLYQDLLDYWGEVDWYVWAETEESLYE